MTGEGASDVKYIDFLRIIEQYPAQTSTAIRLVIAIFSTSAQAMAKMLNTNKLDLTINVLNWVVLRKGLIWRSRLTEKSEFQDRVRV
jgi:hypothetical protein